MSQFFDGINLECIVEVDRGDDRLRLTMSVMTQNAYGNSLKEMTMLIRNKTKADAFIRNLDEYSLLKSKTLKVKEQKLVLLQRQVEIQEKMLKFQEEQLLVMSYAPGGQCYNDAKKDFENMQSSKTKEVKPPEAKKKESDHNM